MEAQGSWYSWGLDDDPFAFDLQNGVSGRDLTRAIEYDRLTFVERFGDVPSCNCGRYRGLYPDNSARRFGKGLLCGLCAKNGDVRVWSAREIRAQLGPSLFTAGVASDLLTSRLDKSLVLDSHQICLQKLGRRVSAPLFVETLRVAAAV